MPAEGDMRYMCVAGGDRLSEEAGQVQGWDCGGGVQLVVGSESRHYVFMGIGVVRSHATHSMLTHVFVVEPTELLNTQLLIIVNKY